MTKRQVLHQTVHSSYRRGSWSPNTLLTSCNHVYWRIIFWSDCRLTDRSVFMDQQSVCPSSLSLSLSQSVLSPSLSVHPLPLSVHPLPLSQSVLSLCLSPSSDPLCVGIRNLNVLQSSRSPMKTSVQVQVVQTEDESGGGPEDEAWRWRWDGLLQPRLDQLAERNRAT